jgi:hypothetical protein
MHGTPSPPARQLPHKLPLSTACSPTSRDDRHPIERSALGTQSGTQHSPASGWPFASRCGWLHLRRCCSAAAGKICGVCPQVTCGVCPQVTWMAKVRPATHHHHHPERPVKGGVPGTSSQFGSWSASSWALRSSRSSSQYSRSPLRGSGDPPEPAAGLVAVLPGARGERTLCPASQIGTRQRPLRE